MAVSWLAVACVYLACASTVLAQTSTASAASTTVTDDDGSGGTVNGTIATTSDVLTSSVGTPIVGGNASTSASTTPEASIASSSSATVAPSTTTPNSTNVTSSTAAKSTTRVIVVAEDSEHFRTLSVGTLMAIVIACILAFLLCLFAIHVYKKNHSHHRKNKNEARRIHRQTMRMKQQSVRRQKHLDSVTDWASSDLSTATLSFSMNDHTLMDDEPGGPKETNGDVNDGKSKKSKKKDKAPSWSEDPEIEETDFGIDNPVRVHNYIVTDSGPSHQEKSGKHTRAKDRAREKLAERRATSAMGQLSVDEAIPEHETIPEHHVVIDNPSAADNV